MVSTPYLDEAERCTRWRCSIAADSWRSTRPTRLRASLPAALLEIVPRDVAEAQEALFGARGLTSQVFGDRLHVWLHSQADAADEADDATRTLIPASQVRVITPSLEDVYIARLARLDETEEEVFPMRDEAPCARCASVAAAVAQAKPPSR